MRHYLIRRYGVKPGWFAHGRTSEDRCAALLPISPRHNPSCSSGGAGTNIENIFQSWDYHIRNDHERTKRTEAGSKKVLSHLLQRDEEASGLGIANQVSGNALPDRGDDLWTVRA